MKQVFLPYKTHEVAILKKFVDQGHIRFFAKDSIIFMPGDTLSSLLFVITGKVKISILQDDGSEVLFYIAQDNQIMSRLFDDHESTLLGKAMQDTVICFFDIEQLKKIVVQEPDVLSEILKSYNSKVCYFKNKLSVNATMKAEKKVCQSLILMGKIYLEEKDIYDDSVYEGSVYINFALPQKIIAELLGIHPVTMSKIFNHLITSGLIEKKNKQLIIKSWQQLKKYYDEIEN